MYTKKKFVEEVIKEWAGRVPGMKPNPKNCQHVAILSEVLYEMEYPEQFINKFINIFNVNQGNACSLVEVEDITDKFKDDVEVEDDTFEPPPSIEDRSDLEGDEVDDEEMDKWIKENLTEVEQKTVTLYHGVKNPSDADKILKQGFKLIYINPLWVNDYAVSAMNDLNSVKKFFGKRKVAILKFKFSGKVATPYETVHIGRSAANARAYTRKMLENDIDAVMLDSDDRVRQFFIYNVKKISNIEKLEENVTLPELSEQIM